MAIDSLINAIRTKERELEVVAHNLANATTNGYKSQNITFRTVLENASEGQGGTDGSETAAPQVAQTEKEAIRVIDFSPGTIVSTAAPLDLALQGDAFFEVSTPEGARYTRNGSFMIDSAGELATPNGEKVMGSRGAIRLSGEGDIQISSSGVVMVGEDEVDTIKLVRFEDPQALEPVGHTLFRAGEGTSPLETSGVEVLQGKVELSNANVVTSLVKLIEISRQYESYQKILASQMKIEQQATQMGRIT